MSDINFSDDILNYELGDVDIEDVLVDDEDDLLLSDEEAPQEKKLSTQQKQQLLDETEEWVSLELARASVKINVIDKIKGDTAKHVKKANETISDVKVDSSTSVIVVDKKDSKITTSDEVVVIKPCLDTEDLNPDEKLNSTQQSAKPKLNRAILKKDKILTPVNEVSSSVEDMKSKNVSEESLKIEDKTKSDWNVEIPVSGNEIDSNTKEISGVIHGLGSEDADSVPNDAEVEDEIDDEREERLNPKLSVERENESEYPNGSPNKHVKHPNSGVPHHENQIPRIGYAPHQHRGPYPQPHGPHSIGNMSNDYHPHPQYQSTPNYHNPQGIRGPSIGQATYRVPLHSGPNGPQSHGPPHNEYGLQVPYRGPRPEHMPQNQAPYAPFNALLVRPQGNMIGPPRFDQMRPRNPCPQFGNPNMQSRPPLHQTNYLPTRSPGIPPQNLPPMPNQSAQSMPHTQQPPVMPRKILINPNFKHGGWEAAKSQLIMDNILSKNIISSIGMTPAQNDDELLRQQEAFITQNRIHIEKRRYERSPERDRDHRDRDYSPPPRRDRRPYSRERDLGPRNDYKQRPKRDGDNYDNRYNQKRRRSESLERDIKVKVEEDEETRVYRLEIEKQKAMREKIIREKEERRKKAAEDKLNPTAKEKKVTSEEVPTVGGGQPPKLTPLIVKESKIISLKKKAASNSTKVLPTAKILPESKKMLEAVLHGKSDSTTAVVKPQMKTIDIKNNLSVKKASSEDTNDEDDIDDEDGEQLVDDEEDDEQNDDNIEPDVEEDDEEIDEDALLADSPSPPPTPPLESFRTRRVVLKSSSKSLDMTNSKILQTKTFSCNNSDETATKIKLGTTGSKGIFDRLDHKKKISVNESAKRAIKRIVINKSD